MIRKLRGEWETLLVYFEGGFKTALLRKLSKNYFASGLANIAKTVLPLQPGSDSESQEIKVEKAGQALKKKS